MNEMCLAVALILVNGSFFTRNSLPARFPVAEIDGNTYWRHPFNSLFHPKQLEEFIIMDINRVHEKKKGAGAGARSNKVRISLFNSCFGPSAQPNSWSGSAWHSQTGLFWVLPLAKGFLGTLGTIWFGNGTGRMWIPLPEILLEEFKLCLLLVIEIFDVNFAALITEFVLLEYRSIAF